LLGELDRLRDPGKKSGMTPRTCWIIPAEGSKSRRVPSRRFFWESTAFFVAREIRSYLAEREEIKRYKTLFQALGSRLFAL
jgi:hypothetical protein